jgi:RNA-directed DNA polymerase
MGKPAATDRPALRSLSHSFTLDFIVGFEDRDDAERFWGELRDRLQQFALELHPEKTRLIEFGRFAAERRARRGQGKPETFDFLGFTHMCSKTRQGKFTVRRKTIAKRLRKKLQEVKETLRMRMHWPIPRQGAWLKSVLLGHYRYYGVPRNGSLLTVFRETVMRYWCQTLRRRSQRHRMTWQRMYALAEHWLPKPHILHPYPAQRLRVTTRGRSPVRSHLFSLLKSMLTVRPFLRRFRRSVAKPCIER